MILLWILAATDVQEVYRVHWLRARATLHRWEEELILTQNEMHWVTNFFAFRQKQWLGWKPITFNVQQGHLAYAERQSAMWSEMAQRARQLFSATWLDFATDSSVFT